MRVLHLIVLLCVCSSTVGQDVTIINNFPGQTTDAPRENFVLSKVTQHTYVVNEYIPLESGPRSQVSQMISYGLRSYIDNQYYASKGKVKALEDPVNFNAAAAAIVRNALWIHDYPFADDFKSFSKQVTDQSKDLVALNGYAIAAENRLPTPPANGKVDLYTFQRMVYDLKVGTEKEVSIFLDKKLGFSEVVYDEEESTDSGTTFLDPLDFGMDTKDDPIDALAQLKPNIDFGEGKKPKRRGRNNDQSMFSDRIVQLLEENNKILANYGYRFEDLQDQINEIRSDRVSTSEMMREEMGALRDMIRDVLAGRVVAESDGSTSQRSDLTPVTIVFEKNAHALSLAHRARLNKVVMDLQLNNNLRAIITGFADRTGNPEFNAWISQQRAEAVKVYLIEQGISSDRLMMNFLGDAESQFANPADRKVEVVYVVNTAAKN